MVKYRLLFTKEEPVRYISHLDLSKLFHRAFRRAGIQVAYSEGFNPHPKIALASALRLGTTSSAEYLDVELEEDLALNDISQRLTRSLPAGVSVKSVQQIPMEAPSAMAVVNAASYDLSINHGEMQVQKLLEDLLSQDTITVSRNTKQGLKEINIRPGIYHAEVFSEGANNVIVRLLLAASDKGTVRPEEIGVLLCERGLCVNEENIQVHRTGLYRIYPDGTLSTPFQVLSKDRLLNPEPPVN